MSSTKLCLLSVAVLLAAASAQGAIFQDDFNAIPDGQPDPAWFQTYNYGYDAWVVEGGVYKSQLNGQVWEWNLVKDLVVGDVSVSADMIVAGSGLVLRMQNPTFGVAPDNGWVLVLFEHYGLDVYFDGPGAGDWWQYAGPWKGSPPEYERLWPDVDPGNVYGDPGHRNEWAHLSVSIVGSTLSASAYLLGNPSISAQVLDVNIPGLAATGYVGIYRSGQPGQGWANGYDNFVVIPEPGALAALSFGLAGLLGLARRRR